MKVVITGANRGIGLELARQCARRGDHVTAAVRSPDAAHELKELVRGSAGKVRVLACDVGSDASVAAFAEAMGDDAVDVLVNNAGVLGSMGPLAAVDFAEAADTYNVDALGPLRVTRALLPLLRRGTGRKIAHISTGMASIADNTGGNAYGYRMAKAALNMASHALANELRGERLISVVINPGWVQTDMGGAGAAITAEVSAAGLLRVIDGLTLEQTGSFLDYRGGTLPW